MSIARIAYAAYPVQRDRTRTVEAKQQSKTRRVKRAARHTTVPLDLSALAAEIGATIGVTR